MPESDNNKKSGTDANGSVSSLKNTKNIPGVIWFPVVLILFGLFLRLIALYSRESVGVDSVRYLTFAQNYLNGSYYTTGPTGLKELPDIGYPLLIALGAKLFNGDLEIVARWISLLAGVLTLIVIYLFTLRAAGFKHAIYALFVSTTCPPLISYSSLIQTESLFIFLLAISAYLSYAATQRGYNTFWFMIGGVCTSYAYLARGIGISFLVMFPLAVWLLSKLQGALAHPGVKRKFAFGSFFFIIGFIIIALPYQILLHRTYNKFIISDQSIWHSPRMMHPEIDFSADPRYDGTLTSDKSDYLINTPEYFNFENTPVTKKIKTFIVKYLKNQIGIYYYHLRELYPPIYLLLMALGFFGLKWSDRLKEIAIIFGIWSIPFLILQPFFYTEARYIAPVTIFLMVFAGIGVVNLLGFLLSMMKTAKPVRVENFTAVVLFLLLTPMMIYPVTHIGPKYNYIDLRDAGEFLEGYTNTRNSNGVLAVTPVIGYYAKTEPNLVLPRGSIETVIEFAEMKDVDFIALAERKVYRNRPELRQVLFTDHYPDSLKLIYDNEDQSGFRVRIFQIDREKVFKIENFELNQEQINSPPFFEKEVKY